MAAGDDTDTPQDMTLACPKCGEQFALSDGIKAEMAAQHGEEMGEGEDASGGSDDQGGGGAYGDAEPTGFNLK
jgi:hypothetical protein